MEGITLAVLAMAAFGLGNALAKTPSMSIGPVKTQFLRGIFSTLLLSFAAFQYGIKMPDWRLLLATVLVGYGAITAFYTSLKLGKIGIVMPIANTGSFVSVIIAVLLFGESLTSNKIGGIALILAGLALMTLDFNAINQSELFSKTSGVYLAIMACLLWGITYVLFKPLIQQSSAVTASFLIEAGVMAAAGIHCIARKESFSLPRTSMLILLAIIGILIASGTLLFNYSISSSGVSVAAPIIAAGPLIGLAYGALVYKERLKAKQYLGAFLSVLGIILMSVYTTGN